MDLSQALGDALWRPSFILKYNHLKEKLADEAESLISPPWDQSALNPKNRVNSLPLPSAGSSWRIDGATKMGTQFYAIPQCILDDVPPLRVDVFAPDQEEYPPGLRHSLDSSDAVVLRDSRAIGNLGISRHLSAALQSFSERQPDFLAQLKAATLPFGSRLVVRHVCANIQDFEFNLEPAYEVERRSQTLTALQKRWAAQLAPEEWPPTIGLADLRLVSQLHDTVSIVSLAADRTSRSVFKTAPSGAFDHLYHELHFLLTCPPHPNIMPRPTHIVTKICTFGGRRGVFGFLLPLYSAGSLRDILPARRLAGMLSFQQQVRWSRDIAAALIHVHENCRSFYPDLRLDNVLLDERGPGGSLLLCDFEQRGNWSEWGSPEVRYRQYAEHLQSFLATSPHGGEALATLIEGYSRHSLMPNLSGGVVQEANRAWFTLSRKSQEKAAVFSLGLFIYCVFEGLSNVCRSVVNAYPIEPDVEFPYFRRTPPQVRRIIRNCTIDAPEWQGDENVSSSEIDSSRKSLEKNLLPRRVVRIRNKVYAENTTHPAGSLDGLRDVLDTAAEWWATELKAAQRFLASKEWQRGEFGTLRPTLREVLVMLADLEYDEGA